jgi:hypothetical protein
MDGTSTKKKGPRNFKRTLVEVPNLVTILEMHRVRNGTAHCFDFKSYHNKPITCAIAAVDLLLMKPLLMDCLNVAPFADLTYKPLKSAFEVVLKKDNGVFELLQAKGTKSFADVASDLSSSVICALAHTRRLKDPVRWLVRNIFNELVPLAKALAVQPERSVACSRSFMV